MKKLEDFQCEKVEVKTIYGGQNPVEECPDTLTLQKGQDGKNDGPDCD